MAVENAPAHERIWIEDIYQNIWSGTSHGTRKQADGIVAVWRKMFARPAGGSEHMGLGGRELQPQRACGHGDQIDEMRMPRGSRDATPVAASPANASPRPEVLQGNAAGFGLRDAGAAAERGR
jgi:uncharacterized protein